MNISFIVVKGKVEVKECLLPFGAHSSVFQLGIHKYKDEDTQKRDFVCCFVWM
jgi:hypothetical protein